VAQAEDETGGLVDGNRVSENVVDWAVHGEMYAARR
jgi:hypothetical protein